MKPDCQRCGFVDNEHKSIVPCRVTFGGWQREWYLCKPCQGILKRACLEATKSVEKDCKTLASVHYVYAGKGEPAPFELEDELTRLREQVASMDTHNTLGSEENVKLWRQLQAANAFCEVAAKMDSFDYHPLMIAWKKLQNWRE